MEKQELIDIISKAQYDYRNGTPTLTDEEYDIYVEKLREIDPNNILLNKPEPESFNKPTIKHPKPMLSTEKVFSEEDLEKWFNRIDKKYTEQIYKITPKLDGMAARYDNGKLSTRGDGYIGYDITDAWNKGLLSERFLPDKRLGEIVMQYDYFEEQLKDKFDHPRNCIVGAMKCDELSDIQKKTLDDGAIHFIPYESLPSYIGTKENMLENLDYYIESLSSINYPIDGFVIEVYNNDEVKEQLGNTSHHYRWQVAYKTISETGVTKVNNVIYQTGTQGAVTPVLEVTATTLSGASIQRVTGHNYGYLAKKHIGIGTDIEIVRSGEVIPKVIDVIDNENEPEYPYQCPVCNTETILDNDIVKCVNIDCPAQIEGKLRNFFKTLKIDLFGKKTIQKILKYYNYNLSLVEVFDITEDEYIEMGFGQGQTENLINSLNDSIMYQYEDYKILASLSIPSLGMGDAKKLMKEYTIQQLLELDINDIENIKGFGKKKSINIHNGLQKNEDVIYTLLNMFNIINTLQETENIKNLLEGKKFVFTGKMQQKRDDMKKLCESKGGVVQSSISKVTDYLVCGENVGKSKLSKAEKYGTVIINENEFFNMIGE